MKEEIARQASTIAVQQVQLAQAEKEISLLKTERGVKDMFTNLIGAHDSIMTVKIRNHLTSKLLPALSIFHEMKGVSEPFVTPKQGGEGSQTIIVTKELKDHLASGSSPTDKLKNIINDSDRDADESIDDALKRKKRDKELDDNLKVTKEAEATEKRNKEKEDILQCKKALFPEWTRDVLIIQAVESPSIYWLEPIASFDCENSKDSQFDMPIRRKAFTFHCFDSTVEVPFPSPKVDRELIDFYLKYGQTQYLTWGAQKIITVKVLKPTPADKFVNVHFKITRGSANSVSMISLADLPNLNPHDWILLYNILLNNTNSKEYEPIV